MVIIVLSMINLVIYIYICIKNELMKNKYHRLAPLSFNNCIHSILTTLIKIKKERHRRRVQESWKERCKEANFFFFILDLFFFCW